jgi:predicted MPP superfamily phosphohydrolase
MPLEGRGTGYTHARAAVEWALHRAYGHGWPAHLAHALGLQGRVCVAHHRLVGRRWRAPFRIAFASDFHAGPTTHAAQLDAATEALHAARPDVLLLGGDYVFLSSRYVGEVADRIRTIPTPLGKFAVLGNHDLWADDRHIVRSLERAGVRVLVNEAIRLLPPFSHVSVCGVDDPWTGSREGHRAFAGVAADEPRILLAHAPEALLTIGDERFELGVCGHTHGGHIALKGGIPIIVPGPLGRRFAHGRFDLPGGRTLIVSRGVGGSESPIRWNADPDVLVIDVGAGETA